MEPSKYKLWQKLDTHTAGVCVKKLAFIYDDDKYGNDHKIHNLDINSY